MTLSLRNFFTLLIVLLSIFKAQEIKAQQIDWSSDSPTLNNNGITVLAPNNDSILVKFTPSISNITTTSISVVLPTNVDFTTTSSCAKKSSGHEASVGFSSAVSGTVSTGTRKCLVTITGGTLASGKTVSLAFPIKANCGAISGNAAISILSAGSTSGLTNAIQNLNIPIQTPAIRLSADIPSIAYASVNETNTFSLKMDAVNGEAKTFKVILRTDKYTVLKNFKLNGIATTAGITKVKASTNPKTDTIYTITFAATDLTNGKLDTNPQTLSFEAKASRCNTHTITSTTQYPSSTACNTTNGVSLTMSYDGIVGLPHFNCPSVQYLAADKSTVLSSTLNLPKDLSTKYYIAIEFLNDGTVDAWDFTANLGLYNMLYGYIDAINIQYQIDGAALKSIDSSMIVSSNNLNKYYIKPAYSNFLYRAKIALDDSIPAGSSIKFFIPCVAGTIHDYGTNNSFITSGTLATFGYYSYLTSANKCAAVAPAYTKSGYESFPVFKESLEFKVLTANQSYTQEVLLSTGGRNFSNLPASYNEQQYFVETPDWIELDGSPNSAFYLENGSGAAYSAMGNVVDHGISGGKHKYSVSYSTGTKSSTAKIVLKYKTLTCPGPSQNYNNQIHFWINSQLGTNSATNPLFENVSQVYQDVMFRCKDDGIRLNEFSLVRTTRGLTDIDNNSTPDAVGGTAGSADVRNELYLTDANDEGYIFWKGSVIGDPADTYKYLYIPVSLIGFDYNNILPDSTNATITINGGSLNSIVFKSESNNAFYFQYDASTNTLKTGDSFEVRLPFKLKVAREAFDYISTECFVSNNPVATPFNTVGNFDKHGEDVLGTSIGIFSSAKAFKAGSKTFADNSTQSRVQVSYFYSYNNSLVAPYFSNEIRRIWYPIELQWDFPDGYIQQSDLEVEFNTGLDAINTDPANKIKHLTGTKMGSTTSYDIASLFDPNSIGTNTLASGKWQLPDDRFIIRTYMDIQATKQAMVGTQSWNTRLVWKNIITGQEITTANVAAKFVYTGPTINLNLSSTKINAYGDSLNIPITTVINPSDQDINNVWLYVGGNVKNVFLSNVGTNTPVIAGSGFEGRWLHIKSLLAAMSSEQYQLNFSYTGNSTCSVPDTLKVYAVSGFSDPSWVAPSTNALDLNDIEHLGIMKNVPISVATASIGGSLNVSNTKITYDNPYTFSASISSKSGEGALMNPQMTITIPAGQLYEDNSATIEYPLGNIVPVSPAVNTALLALNSNLTTDRTFVFNLKNTLGSTDNIMMVGFLSPNANTYNQTAIFTATFKPMCDSKLVGARFKGILEGSSACGNTAKYNGTAVYSQKMAAENEGSYLFNISTNMSSYNNAFNEFRNTDELTISINKLTHINDSIAVSDYLEIEIPSCFNISNPIYSAAVIDTATILSNTVNADTRTIKISIPADKLNGLVMKDAPFVLKMAMEYTADGQNWANKPVNSIDVNMITGASFGPCTNKEISCGYGNQNIAILTSLSPLAKACLNMPNTLVISSDGYQGNWYADATASTLLASGNSYEYTPTSQSPTTKTFYIKSIFGGINYGILPINLDMNPLAIANISSIAANACEGVSISFTDMSTVNGLAANTSNIMAWSWFDNTTGSSIANTQNANHSFTDAGNHDIILTLISTEGCISYDTASIIINKIPTITITDGYFCAPGTVSYSASSDVPTANYKWYNNLNDSIYNLPDFLTPTLHANTQYYIQAFNNGCNSTKKLVEAIAYPEHTQWIGSINSDWFNISNWSNGLPGYCTSIEIMQSSNYPDLAFLSGNVACRKITFEPGTSIFGLEKLTYDSAQVKIDLKRNKWYMLTSPLKEMYSGDYYMEGAPVTYMKLFGTNTSASAGTNIQTVTGNWTNSFASLKEKLTPGEGFAFMIDNVEWHYPTGQSTVSTDKTITFPRTNADGSLKTTATPISIVTGKLYPTMAQSMPKDNAKAYRFAMENASNQLSSISITVKTGLNLIGNPLMSHLDFNSLYIDNNSLISNYVQFWDGSSFGSITTSGTVSGTSIEGLSLRIPPMKSFVVNALHDGTLIINLNNFTPNGNVNLKGAAIKENTLYIESNNGLAKNSSALVMNPKASNTNDQEDVCKLYTQTAGVPEVYTVSGKKALDINQFNSFPYIVPIGIKSGGADSVNLNFKGVESFEGVEVKLINTATSETQDLKENCTYCFKTDGNNSEGTLFLEFRTASSTTGNAEIANTNTGIQILTGDNNNINVLSSSENRALEILVYDPLGKLVSRKTALSNTSESVSINHPGKVFIVKVISEKGVETKKIVLD